jgi:predicted solute-binding protein
MAKKKAKKVTKKVTESKKVSKRQLCRDMVEKGKSDDEIRKKLVSLYVQEGVDKDEAVKKARYTLYRTRRDDSL